MKRNHHYSISLRRKSEIFICIFTSQIRNNSLKWPQAKLLTLQQDHMRMQSLDQSIHSIAFAFRKVHIIPRTLPSNAHQLNGISVTDKHVISLSARVSFATIPSLDL